MQTSPNGSSNPLKHLNATQQPHNITNSCVQFTQNSACVHTNTLQTFPTAAVSLVFTELARLCNTSEGNGPLIALQCVRKGVAACLCVYCCTQQAIRHGVCCFSAGQVNSQDISSQSVSTISPRTLINFNP